MSFRRGFKLTADADLQGGYIAELESRHGNAYLTLIFYDEQQDELRELLENCDGQVMLYLGPVREPVAEVAAPTPVWTHSCENQGCGSSTCESCGPYELQKTKDYLTKYRQLTLREKGRRRE